MKKAAVLVCFLLLSGTLALHAQQQLFVITGSVIDSASKEALTGARVQIIKSDNTIIGGGLANKVGVFYARITAPGTYTVSISSLGYLPYKRSLTVSADTTKIGTIRLISSAVKTSDIVVTEKADRMVIKGDTAEYNAKAFKTDKNAAAEDLIRKMPGIEVDPNGTVKAQGEQVRRVLVDGKPFFGEDPTAALRNLPSEVIDRVQVMDQMSDQAQFTRFDDGDRTKTLNIITRPDRRNGQFGKLYAGIGSNTDSLATRFTAGGNVNFFNGNRRISLIVMSNNINQQNFSIQDILGVLGSNNQANQMMRMVGGAGNAGAMMRMGGGGRNFGGGGGGMSNVGSFLVGQSDGITAAHALGVNYTDTWSKQTNVNGSYFVNFTDNENLQLINRQTFVSDGVTLRNEDNSSRVKNMNHRLNFRIEHSLDSSNSLIFTPRLTLQSNDRFSASQNSTTSESGTVFNTSDTRFDYENLGYSFEGDLLWRHRFVTEGRTLSTNFRVSANNNSGDGLNNATNSYFGIRSITDSLRQDIPMENNGVVLSANLNYTEPIHDKGQLQLSYNVSWNISQSDKQVMDYNVSSNEYDQLNNLLSNKSSSGYITHRPGVSYRLAMGQGSNFNIGADVQIADLSVEQQYPVPFELKRQFINVLPNASLQMRFGMTSNLRFNYRGFTNQPGIRQLQNVIDNTDPIRLSIGNPDLKQENTHFFSANYGTFNVQTANAFFVVVSARLTNDKIANSSLFALRDTTIEGAILGAGQQLTKPVNLNGFVNANSFVVYSFPFEPISGLRLNTSVTGGVTYSRDVSIINGATNIANTYGLTPALSLSSNISENLDFTVAGRTSYNIAENSLQSDLNNNYFIHTLNCRLNWIFWEGFLLNADFNYLAYSGLTGDLNRSIPLLSLGIGKRFMDGNGEIKLSVFDALNQNTSISRNVTSGYIEDLQTVVLRRYALLTFTYNLRAF